MADLAVRLLNVSYSSGGKQILSGLNICFRPGSFNVVLGPNGAGKSTLMRIAAGRFAPSSGKVLYGDLPAMSLDATWLAQRRAFLSANRTILSVASGGCGVDGSVSALSRRTIQSGQGDCL